MPHLSLSRLCQVDSEVMQKLVADLRTKTNEYATVKSPKGSWEGKVWD